MVLHNESWLETKLRGGLGCAQLGCRQGQHRACLWFGVLGTLGLVDIPAAQDMACPPQNHPGERLGQSLCWSGLRGVSARATHPVRELRHPLLWAMPVFVENCDNSTRELIFSFLIIPVFTTIEVQIQCVFWKMLSLDGNRTKRSQQAASSPETLIRARRDYFTCLETWFVMGLGRSMGPITQKCLFFPADMTGDQCAVLVSPAPTQPHAGRFTPRQTSEMHCHWDSGDQKDNSSAALPFLLNHIF